MKQRDKLSSPLFEGADWTRAKIRTPPDGKAGNRLEFRRAIRYPADSQPIAVTLIGELTQDPNGYPASEGTTARIE